jgi:hypothetical protein
MPMAMSIVMLLARLLVIPHHWIYLQPFTEALQHNQVKMNFMNRFNKTHLTPHRHEPSLIDSWGRGSKIVSGTAEAELEKKPSMSCLGVKLQSQYHITICEYLQYYAGHY